MTEVVQALLPKQLDFCRAPEKECLYSGAYRAGKTRALCAKTYKRASHPGAVEGLCRKSLVNLKRTTLRTLLESESGLPPIIPPGSYTHRVTEQRIFIHGGGRIQYFGLDNPEKIGSLSLSGAGIDEAVEITERDYIAVGSRCSIRGYGIQRQLNLACNPGPPMHWVAQRFGLSPGGRAHDGCMSITTKSADNYFLPPDYMAWLESLQGLAYKRYVLGQWVTSDRLVYSMWDRSLFMPPGADDATGPWSRVAIGIDEGFTHPAALVVVCEDADGRVHVADEWVQSGKIEAEFVDMCKRYCEKWNPERFVVPPECAALIESMRRAGLSVSVADNARMAGVQNVRNRLVVPRDGRPRLTVHSRCVEVIRGFETWETLDRAGKEEYSKVDDDAMDALRYACMYLGGGGSWPADTSADDVPGELLIDIDSESTELSLENF